MDMCRLAYLPDPTNEEVEKLHRESLLFYKHFENDYYMNQMQNVRLMKCVYHLVLHLAESLRYCGPLCSLDQFKVERYIGSICKKVKSRSKSSENVSRSMAESEALRMYCMIVGESEDFENEERALKLRVQEKGRMKPHEKFLVEDYVYRNCAEVGSMSEADWSRTKKTFRRYHHMSFASNLDQVSFKTFYLLNRRKGDVRRNCYVTLIYEGGTFYYARLHGIFIFEVHGRRHKAVWVKCATKLRVTSSGQVYSDQNPIFQSSYLEPISCITPSSSLGLIKRPDQNRAYFIDLRPRRSVRDLKGRL